VRFRDRPCSWIIVGAEVVCCHDDPGIDVIADLIASHGYWIVAAIVALESMGIPVPGETVLVTAAIFAGTTHRLSIGIVIGAAAVGAIVGDNIGYALGRRFGYRLLVRYGPAVRIEAGSIKIGRLLFARHGGSVVFFGRFIAVLRTLSALLAGINGMDWRRFLFFNATGGIVWAASFGVAAYILGERLEQMRSSFVVVTMAIAAALVIGGTWWARRHEGQLRAEAERAFPGPLPVR
jgi:membrane protein DedA with SNARE-associated domain